MECLVDGIVLNGESELCFLVVDELFVGEKVIFLVKWIMFEDSCDKKLYIDGVESKFEELLIDEK